MYALLSLVVALTANPAIQQTVIPDYRHADGRPITFMECLTGTGQQVASQWLAEHPGHQLLKINCSVATDAERLRAQIQQPEA